MELQHLGELLAKGVNVSTAILMVAVFNGYRVSKIEKQVARLAEVHRNCPRARKNRVAVPVLLSVAFIASLLLSGCAGAGFVVRIGVEVPPGTNTPPAVVKSAQ